MLLYKKKHLTGNVHILGHSLTVLISRAVLLKKKKKRAKPHIQSPTGHVYSFHHSPFKVVIAGPQKHINISCCHHYNHLKVLSASELTFICLHFHKASNEKNSPASHLYIASHSFAIVAFEHQLHPSQSVHGHNETRILLILHVGFKI